MQGEVTFRQVATRTDLAKVTGTPLVECPVSDNAPYSANPDGDADSAIAIAAGVMVLLLVGRRHPRIRPKPHAYGRAYHGRQPLTVEMNLP